MNNGWKAFEDELKRRTDRINNALATLSQNKPAHTSSKLWESMTYSLNIGGKRIRPILALEGAKLAGVSENLALPLALAFEMAHTASLIHDDLPAMDNDVLRRGKPTNHTVYGEAMAILAGDTLLTYGVEFILQHCTTQNPEGLLKAVYCFSQALGPQGICSGQALDIDLLNKRSDLDFVTTVANQKTAALLRASVVAGAHLGSAPEALIEALHIWGSKIGVAFQVCDDILDCVSNAEVLGKTPGKDAAQHKNTFVEILGLDGARQKLDQLTKEANIALAPYNGTEFLCDFALWMKDRIQ